MISVGVDVGGTFTDLVAVGAEGAVQVSKVLTTPHDRSMAVLQTLHESAVPPDQITRFVHGTTVVTNLLLERAGTRVVLLATAGFADLLWLRRQERASLYDLTRDHPAPLVQPGDVISVHERVAPHWSAGADAAQGLTVLQPLEPLEIERVVQAAIASGAQAFAIVLLHGYAYAAHEQALAHALRTAMPGATVAASHEVLPEIREYERTATTVAEAYARPAVRRYLHTLADALAERGVTSPRVMTSAGGTLHARDADQHAASLALSGPAGGVTAAAALCRALGLRDALTIDIGGTSADVGLVIDGEPLVERGGDVDGVPIALPRVLVETVAAGGGSIGRLDSGGALHAGPESAGADPGPACYGRGGHRATVTDAHVALGHITAGTWGGAVTIRADHAEAAVSTLATALGRTVRDTAAALIATADANMARALRRISVERGRDPRDLVLVAFGGGGPLHACGLADMLGMRQVYVPPWAGVLSALGLALAPERRDAMASLMQRSDQVDVSGLHARKASLAHTLMAAHEAFTVRAWVRARYMGQGHELDVAFHDDDSINALCVRFGAVHAARFGYELDRPVELVSVRVTCEGTWWPLTFTRPPRTALAVFDGVDDGTMLEVIVPGPCTIRLPDATMRVAHGWSARALPSGGWWLERAGAVT